MDLKIRDSSLATTSKSKQGKPQAVDSFIVPKVSRWKRFTNFLYDSQAGTYCGRTCRSWLSITAYAIIYLIFLSTYTLIFLYFSLLIIRSKTHNQIQPSIGLVELLTYPETGIGLTGTPTHLNDYPLIWYREGITADYEKYVKALDELLGKERTRRDGGPNLGPCATSPYGYGDSPCVLIKINKQLTWADEPLNTSSPLAKDAPEEVKNWMKSGKKKYWLHCYGLYSYDKEHIGRIKYYPDPPGFDPKLFPIPENGTAPMVAIQITDFTHGISLAIECKLWYGHGVSTFSFVLYVMPLRRPSLFRTVRNETY